MLYTKMLHTDEHRDQWRRTLYRHFLFLSQYCPPCEGAGELCFCSCDLSLVCDSWCKLHFVHVTMIVDIIEWAYLFVYEIPLMGLKENASHTVSILATQPLCFNRSSFGGAQSFPDVCIVGWVTSSNVFSFTQLLAICCEVEKWTSFKWEPKAGAAEVISAVLQSEAQELCLC